MQPGDLTGTDRCIFYAKLEIGSTESKVQFPIVPVKHSNLTEAEKNGIPCSLLYYMSFSKTSMIFILYGHKKDPMAVFCS